MSLLLRTCVSFLLFYFIFWRLKSCRSVRSEVCTLQYFCRCTWKKHSSLLHKIYLFLKDTLSDYYFLLIFSMFLPQCVNGCSDASAAPWGPTVRNQRRPPWVPTPPAGQSRTLSTTQSSQTWWRPCPWPPAAWPLQTASGPVPRGPPGHTGPQTERCPYKRGAASRGSLPLRPSECPSRILMWAERSYRHDTQSRSCLYLVFISFPGLRPAQSVQDEERNREGECKYSCCCRSAEVLKPSVLPCRVHMEWWS